MKFPGKRLSHWLWILAAADGVFTFLVWIVRPEAFRLVVLLILLFTASAIWTGLWLEDRRQRKISEALETFLEFPDERSKDILIQALGKEWRGPVEELYQTLNRQSARLREKTGELASYREFIEAWVHEVKTPLFLLSLVTDNHREELPPAVAGRLDHIQHQLTGDVERILYYARLQGEHADYKFTRFRLDECVEEVLAEAKPAMDERRIAVRRKLEPLDVVSDRKTLHFMLSQLLSNAVKYADSEDGLLSISMHQTQDKIHLAIWNNGPGVPPEDVPFLFDKGFTGNHPERQKATGMGLYLVKKYAGKLCVDVGLNQTGGGFEIELVFTL